MTRQPGGPCLSAVFVDYDNIYLSLKRKSEEAAKRFAKDASVWLREIENGRLITATNAAFDDSKRRIVMNRCYGNPVPRRNQNDNSTDMNSFPFVRHHFLRSGFEVIDCPPLTAQLKNSSDIRMVMDVRDYLTHDTYFDEFIILSGDADFTPVLHRLRAHARRTVIFANDFTAAPYTAISDGEVREADLISLILNGQISDTRTDGGSIALAPSARIEDVRRDILAEVVGAVRAASAPMPLEALAERAVRTLGHDKTIASGWAGAGSFRELLLKGLPEDIRLTNEPPYLAFDARRQGEPKAPPLQAHEVSFDASRPANMPPLPGATGTPTPVLGAGTQMMPPKAEMLQPSPPTMPQMQRPTPPPPMAAARAPEPRVPMAPPVSAPPAATAPQSSTSSAIQKSIARIQEACQAPPLAPPEYRLLFEVMASEINDNDLIGSQTLTNVVARAQERGLEIRKDDVRFILEVVSEADPWFEQGASANLFAGRFRNFVVARCRGQGLNLSADELDLIDAWFAGGAAAPAAPPARSPAPSPLSSIPEPQGGGFSAASEEFPRIVRTRLR